MKYVAKLPPALCRSPSRLPTHPLRTRVDRATDFIRKLPTSNLHNCDSKWPLPTGSRTRRLRKGAPPLYCRLVKSDDPMLRELAPAAVGSRNLGPTCFCHPCPRVLSRRPPRLKPLNLNCPFELIASGRAHLISELEGRWLRWCPKSRWSCNFFPSYNAELPAQKFLDLMSIRSAKKCICLLQKKIFCKSNLLRQSFAAFHFPQGATFSFFDASCNSRAFSGMFARSLRAKVALSFCVALGDRRGEGGFH